MLRNRANQYIIDYPVRYIATSYSPSVWGDAVFVSPVIVEGTNEGIRGELEGVYIARAENLVNEDEIVIAGSKYKAFVPPTTGVTSSFPAGYAILFKLP
jgi:hypothetical protein